MESREDNRYKVTSRAAWMFRGGFAWLNAVQNTSGERQWKRKEIESIPEYWSELSRRSPRKRESLNSLTTREISLTGSCRNFSALIKWEISPVYWNRSFVQYWIGTLRACLHGGGGPQVGEVTRLGEVKKWPSFTCNLTTPPSRGALSQDYWMVAKHVNK